MKKLNLEECGYVSGGFTAIGVDTGRMDNSEIAIAAGVGAGVLGAVGLVSGTLGSYHPGNSVRSGDTGLGGGIVLGLAAAAIGAVLGALGSVVKQKYYSTHGAIIS